MMNEITHFLSGYLVARGMKYKEDSFEAFFLALAAVLPDIDYFLGLFFRLEHGVFTHTYVGGILLVLIFACITYFLVLPLLKKSGVTFSKLVWLGFIGISLHFLLDSFTFHYGSCSPWLHPDVLAADCICPGPECFSNDDLHHLYFWPLWDFPPHINTIFPYLWMTFEVRVWVEVVVTCIFALIVLWMWLKRKENVWGVFFPTAWWRNSIFAQKEKDMNDKDKNEMEDARRVKEEKPRIIIRVYPELFKELPKQVIFYFFGVFFVIAFPLFIN